MNAKKEKQTCDALHPSEKFQPWSDFYPCLSMFIHVYPCLSMFLHVSPCLSHFSMERNHGLWPLRLGRSCERLSGRSCAAIASSCVGQLDMPRSLVLIDMGMISKVTNHIINILVGGLEHYFFFSIYIIYIIYIYPYIGNNHPNWLIFFRGVQTTNQYINMYNFCD